MINIPSIQRKAPRPAYRKPEAIKELEAIADKAYSAKHPQLPSIRHIFTDKTTAGLTNCVVKYLSFKGAFVSRINNTGVYDQRLKIYRRSTSRNGLADIMSVYNSLSLHIEIKYGNDRQSEAQKKIQKEVEVSGGIYYIARNFTDFKKWFDNL